jgi:Tfp pilus assembly PilM family ATPase/Tfp pilus assembly protein PilN
MNIAHLITREAPVGGLEIHQRFLRVGLFKGRTKNTHTNFEWYDEKLPDGVIVNGVIAKKDIFVQTLRKLLATAELGTPYFIVSVPSQHIYTKILKFPPSISSDRIDEAVNLSFDFHMPVKPETTYIDHYRIPIPGKNDVVLGLSSRTTVDAYIDALQQAGVRPVALESHAMSIAYTLQNKPDPILFSIEDGGATLFIIVQDQVARFTRLVPQQYLLTSATAVQDEIRKIRDYYSVEESKIPTVLTIDQLPVLDIYTDIILSSPEKTGLLTCIGAASRGALRRSEDTYISLLPVGTEKAYSYQQIRSFTSFIRNLTVTLCLFFIAAYLGAFLFMSSIQERFAKTLTSLSSLPVSAEIIESEKKAREFNELVNTTSTFVQEIPQWSLLLEKLLVATNDAIIVTSVGIASPTQPIHISGLAKNRLALNDYKKTLENIDLITDITLPLTNLEQREDVPFTITFLLKDPTSLYIQ